jgi:L-2-hydroxyglutarate oxidase LhgO
VSERLETAAVVVGAGIVGVSTAALLGRALGRVVVIERRDTFGLEVSSRSSEVVHAGLYYAPGSAKAELCLEGAATIHAIAAERSIPLRRLGKLVAAVEQSEREELERLFVRARHCGARDLELWGRARLAREEPDLPAVAALYSPWTAVVDSFELLRSFFLEAREQGVEFAFRHTLRGLEPGPAGTWIAAVEAPTGETIGVETPIVVNAAGLCSDDVAAMAGIDVAAASYVLHPCKGEYFSLRARACRGLRRLVYPLPEANEQGLGVHLTFDVAGSARLGPDSTYVDRSAGYEVDATKASAFLAMGRRLLPWLEASDLAPERSGIRPKLAGPGEPARDFVIEHESARGLVGLVNLVGIESPGLTAAPAIARRVHSLLAEAGALPRRR